MTRPKRPIARRASSWRTSPTSFVRRCTGSLSYARFGVEEAEAGDRGELREFFDNVGHSAETLLDLVNDLLDLSKLEAGRMTFDLQPTCMDSPIEVVVDEFRSMIARKDIRIRYGKPEETLIVAGR